MEVEVHTGKVNYIKAGTLGKVIYLNLIFLKKFFKAAINPCVFS